MLVVRCLLCGVICLLIICCALVVDRCSLCVVRRVPLVVFFVGSLLFGVFGVCRVLVRWLLVVVCCWFVVSSLF